MRRLERLVNLLAALIQTDRPLSRSDIYERVPGYPPEVLSFRRAFERDKDTLRNMGIPLVLEPIDVNYPDHGEGYRIPRDKYHLPDPGFTKEEMQALAIAASAVKLESQAAAAAIWKLTGDSKIVDIESADANSVELTLNQTLPVMFAARSERRNVSFVYRGKRRTVSPLRLSFRNGHWYVKGRDYQADEDRTFRLDRIEGEIETSEPNSFEPMPTPSQTWLPAWQMGDDPMEHAKLLVDADYAELAIGQTGADAIEESYGDGSVLLRFDVTNKEAFRSFALGFLDHVEILEPESLRRDIVAHLESMVNR